jgi:hypothetical protein
MFKLNLLISFAGNGHGFDVKAVFSVGLETGQLGSGLSRIPNGRFPFDLGSDFGAFHFFVKDFVASQIAVGLFWLLPDQVESRRA